MAHSTPRNIEKTMTKKDDTNVSFNVFKNAGSINDQTDCPVTYEFPKSN
jgi:hypothetical protein